MKQVCVHKALLWALRGKHMQCPSEGLAQREVGKGHPSSASTQAASITHLFPMNSNTTRGCVMEHLPYARHALGASHTLSHVIIRTLWSEYYYCQYFFGWENLCKLSSQRVWLQSLSMITFHCLWPAGEKLWATTQRVPPHVCPRVVPWP